MTKTVIALYVTAALIIAALATSRPYSGLNAGIAWDWGGVEIVGTPGLFICPAAYDYPHKSFMWNRPLESLFPALVVDC
jgi:hypothetical protein